MRRTGLAGIRVPGSLLLAGLLLGLVLLIPHARAETTNRWSELATTVFRNYGPQDGLPPLISTALAQDGDGFIWIGTQAGLFRWDGYHFRSFGATAAPGAADQPVPASASDPPDEGLSGSWITVLHPDARGRLWIGTDSNGLGFYDRDHDRVVPVGLSPAPGEGTHIGAISDDGDGGLWVGTDRGLVHLVADKPTGTAWRHRADDETTLPGDKVQAVLRDHHGRLWIGTDQGLARGDPGAGVVEPIALIPGSAPVIVISTLFEDREGRIWIGTTQHGVFVIDPGTAAAKPVIESGPEPSTLAAGRITAIAEAGEHELWFALRTTGIVALDLLTGKTRRIRHDKLVQSSLAHDDLWSMIADRAGAIWISGAGGLSFHPPDPGVVTTLFGDTMIPAGITDPDVVSVLETQDGRIWLAFLTGGLDVIDPAVGRIAQIRPDPSHPDTALPQDVVTAMIEADDSTVFVGTVRGAYRVDQRSHQVRLADLAGRDPHDYVRTLHVQDSTLWVGGPGGLWGIPLPGANRRLWTPADFTGFTNQSILALARGRAGELWVGTFDGLNRLDLATGQIETIRAEPRLPTTLPGRIIAALRFDRQERLWVGTFGGGIGVMTGRDPAGGPVFRRIGTADGLPHPDIDRLLMDGTGIMWASTDDGLAAIDPADFRTTAIRRADGAPLTVYWVQSGTTDRSGEPLFGAKGGVSVVHPGWPRVVPEPARVVVSEVRIAGRPVPGSRFNGAGSAEPLVLTPETNSLSVEFAALDFTAPDSNRYAYRLDGFDRDWLPTDATHRLAAYTNLPPGDYRLRLRGSNRAGQWATAAPVVPIRVMPAWYQTLAARVGFWTLLAAGALLTLSVVVRSRTAYLRRHQAELERQIASRTADLRAANQRLSELATTDPLTGCANRRHFIERASALVGQGDPDQPICLAILDLDHFKLINDKYGHPVGDEVLRIVGQTSRRQVRAGDLVGRIGGEEFGLLMPATPLAAARSLADRLRAALAETVVRSGDREIGLTASLGLAERRQGEDFDALYARADLALYAAKAAGRNRVMSEAPAPQEPDRPADQ